MDSDGIDNSSDRPYISPYIKQVCLKSGSLHFSRNPILLESYYTVSKPVNIRAVISSIFLHKPLHIIKWKLLKIFKFSIIFKHLKMG